MNTPHLDFLILKLSEIHTQVLHYIISNHSYPAQLLLCPSHPLLILNALLVIIVNNIIYVYTYI